ncbi:helix-turn-helix domain-containing protein [Shewanella sp. NKUCC05_KAH]|uniref:YdaS family helix-turn-helix protein n=1 Tax=Shewanella TaxID=22 RepID=UPI001C5B289E|nr:MULTISPECIES: YdaS family helix-turn-helix protein [Shewanella]MBW3528153.1 helix-turn-helix domain-containing protein [Shewanella sp. NKUCC05_KAH]MCS6236231.1 helix-turn-helix domain-containing protein [Shewanella baltica]MCS6270656.1 helix-turn-helix domain-containing protein [Shewanella baltica]
MSHIEAAVKIIGGQTKTARQFNIRQTHVWKWIHVNKQAPAKYIKRIAALTNHEITVEQLLADHEQNHKAKGMQQ